MTRRPTGSESSSTGFGCRVACSVQDHVVDGIVGIIGEVSVGIALSTTSHLATQQLTPGPIMSATKTCSAIFPDAIGSYAAERQGRF